METLFVVAIQRSSVMRYRKCFPSVDDRVRSPREAERTAESNRNCPLPAPEYQ
jgi:hypothetical protein